jgi:ABC-2 type transport system ATP-binding protein
MRVKEYLRFCARLREIHGKAIQACVDQAMERCQLHAVANRLIGQLSKGYQQRTGIAQAILHAPKLLILDEPTVGLDPNQLAEIRRLIKQIGESCTIILSTHILAEVEATCDRVLILKEGHKVFDGTMDQFNPQQMRDWTIRFLAPPSTDQLSTFLQELRIDQIASDTWKIRNLTDENRLSLLLDHAVSQGWRPIELYRHQHTLEEKFIALTCGQEPPENTMDSLKMEPV